MNVQITAVPSARSIQVSGSKRPREAVAVHNSAATALNDSDGVSHVLKLAGELVCSEYLYFQPKFNCDLP
jgi:hypothetical protein